MGPITIATICGVENQVDVSILIVNWNACDMLRQCLHSLSEGTAGVKTQVIVIDNASGDGSAAMVRTEFPQFELICNLDNVGFARANNQAYRRARGRSVFLLNPDTEVRPGVVARMVDFLEADPQRSGVTGVLRNPDGTLQRYQKRLPRWSYILFSETVLRNLMPQNRWAKEFYLADEPFDQIIQVEQPPAACLLLRRSVLGHDTIFDERFPIFYNDVDLCRTLHDRGHRLYLLPGAEIMHHGGGGGVGRMPDHGVIDSLIGLIRYYRKHEGWVAAGLLWVILTVNSVIVLLGGLCKVFLCQRPVMWWKDEVMRRVRLALGRESFHYPSGLKSGMAGGAKKCQC